MWNSFKKELREHPITYSLLLLILLGAFFVRAYRVSDLLQFYYDQGRDALIIWDLWHNGKPFLIGPVTGLTGIFLGPFYYYLIAPLYFIGGGNPAYPAIFLSFLSVCALSVLYYLGWQMQSRIAGLIAATVGGFSYYMMLSGRWLSNPTPILFTSTLLLLSLWKILKAKNKYECKWWWPAVALIVGLSMQFESASAIFYISMVFVFTLWQWRKFPPLKQAAISLVLFIMTLAPQLWFNYRHENLLFNNFSKLFFQEHGFQLDFWEVLSLRFNFFWNVFHSKINPSSGVFGIVFTILSFALIIFNRNLLKSKNTLLFFSIFLGVPMLGYIFFQGNSGNIYDYYMTGYYLPMILLFSLGLGFLWNSWLGRISLVVFFFLFLQINLILIKNYVTAGVDGPTDVRLKSERQAVNWVFYDARINDKSQYNVDVYVPPVIPYTYDYLFEWLGTKECGEGLCGNVKESQMETIYLLYEVDPPHPERLQAFLDRYKDNSVVEDQHKFGGITVERRKRIK